jgi:hypothetical protein
MTEGPKQFCYRASCNSVEIRLRVNPDAAWIILKRPGNAAHYIDLDDQDVDAVVARFNQIGDSPALFDDFVRSIVNTQGAHESTLTQ